MSYGGDADYDDDYENYDDDMRIVMMIMTTNIIWILVSPAREVGGRV